MSIVIPDIDIQIVKFASLASLPNLLRVNKFFYGLISTKQLLRQWKRNKLLRNLPEDYIFAKSCKDSFLEYAVCLFNDFIIDLRYKNNIAFRNSCASGHLLLSQWLLNRQR